jgi:hypothetical protein
MATRGSVFSPPGDSTKCETCTKTVYAQEKISYDNVVCLQPNLSCIRKLTISLMTHIISAFLRL